MDFKNVQRLDEHMKLNALTTQIKFRKKVLNLQLKIKLCYNFHQMAFPLI